MELEKIRAAETQLRWQDDEDVDECRNCRVNFTVTRRKVRPIMKLVYLSTEMFMTYVCILASLPTLRFNLLREVLGEDRDIWQKQ